MTDDLKAVRFQDLVHEVQDREDNNPAVEHGGYSVHAEEEPIVIGKKRILWLLDAQTEMAEKSLEYLTRFLSQIRNLEQVHHDVVSIKSQQRIPIKDDRTDRADKHHTQCQMIEQPGIGKPPDECGEGSQDQFDVHSCCTYRSTGPLAGKHPRIGHIAIQTRRKDQQHHPHFVTFAAKILTRQSVPELVQDLHNRHGCDHVDPVMSSKELVE